MVNGLQAVQWQLLGYESKADGQPDHERPLYSMSNPNPVVNSIVRRYATDTMANLHVRGTDWRELGDWAERYSAAFVVLCLLLWF